MSKFEDIQQAYLDARHAFFARRSAAHVFATGVYEGLEAYFGAPRFVLHFRPGGGDMSSARSLKAEEGVRYADGAWRFTFGLDLKEGSKENTAQTVMVAFDCVEDGDGFSLGVAGADRRFRLPAKPGPADCVPLGDYLFERALATYRQPGQVFFDTAAVSIRRIG